MRDSDPQATPLLLLPGLMCDSRIWAPQIEALSAQRETRSFDDAFGGADSLVSMAEHVLSLAPPRFALAGHSMGGRVALEVYRRAPERIERLALLSTGTHSTRPNEAEGRYKLLALGKEQGMDALVDAWLTPMVHEPNRAKAGLMASMHQMCCDMGLETYERQIHALLERPEVESLLPSIRCPTLVGTGSYDSWAPPAQHEAIAAAIPGAVLAIVGEAGHMLPVEQPEALTDALASWLNMS